MLGGVGRVIREDDPYPIDLHIAAGSGAVADAAGDDVVAVSAGVYAAQMTAELFCLNGSPESDAHFRPFG